jgi:hypothetical protein
MSKALLNTLKTLSLWGFDRVILLGNSLEAILHCTHTKMYPKSYWIVITGAPVYTKAP